MNRFLKSCKRFVPLIFLGLCYYIWILVTGLKVPCLFRSFTGFLCPGCGVTSMCMAILSLDFPLAYNSNPFLFVTLPFVIFEVLYSNYIFYIKASLPRWNVVLTFIYLFALLAFTLWRNIG